MVDPILRRSAHCAVSRRISSVIPFRAFLATTPMNGSSIVTAGTNMSACSAGIRCCFARDTTRMPRHLDSGRRCATCADYSATASNASAARRLRGICLSLRAFFSARGERRLNHSSPDDLRRGRSLDQVLDEAGRLLRIRVPELRTSVVFRHDASHHTVRTARESRMTLSRVMSGMSRLRAAATINPSKGSRVKRSSSATYNCSGGSGRN